MSVAALPVAAQRAAVAAEALTWLNTPYRPRTAIKGVGADCGMFPLAVFASLGLVPRDVSAQTHAPQWNLHQQAELYLNFILAFGFEIGRADLDVGDMVVWRFGMTYSHGAIVLDPPRIIHALWNHKRVVLGDMDRDEDYATRPARYFSAWRPDHGG